MAVDWTKVLLAIGSLALGWVTPRAYRTIKNLGKTKQKIAEDNLAKAQAEAREAHANADPNDDAAKDAAVLRAQKSKESADYWAAVADGFAESPVTDTKDGVK